MCKQHRKHIVPILPFHQDAGHQPHAGRRAAAGQRCRPSQVPEAGLRHSVSSQEAAMPTDSHISSLGAVHRAGRALPHPEHPERPARTPSALPNPPVDAAHTQPCPRVFVSLPLQGACCLPRAPASSTRSSCRHAATAAAKRGVRAAAPLQLARAWRRRPTRVSDACACLRCRACSA